MAATVLEKEKDEEAILEMAGGGFESTVRLAKSSIENVHIFSTKIKFIIRSNEYLLRKMYALEI